MIEFDTSLFDWLNTDGGPFLDGALELISTRYFAIPVYLYLAFRLFSRFKPLFLKSLLSIALLILVCDQLSVAVKNTVERKRPCHEAALQADIHLVDGRCGGLYGFYSSHASNTMALTVFLSLLFQNRWVTVLLGTWTVLVGYSRIYLGAHYPLDVLSGWAAGATLAYLAFLLFRRFSFSES
jgi:undecaprenyl-diphosphatase